MPGRLRGAVKEARAVLDRVRPDVVVGYGGYVSVPAYLAARRAKLPIVVHEQNALPGLANKVGARFAQRVAVSFPDTPLRQRGVRRPADPPDDLRRSTGARCAPRRGPSSASTPTGPRCWSPAARRAPAASTRRSPAPPAASAQAGVQVLHVVGPKNDVGARRTDVPPYVAVGYVDRMDFAHAAADLMVCRAGANSVTEAAAVGLPAIFVPLPIGNGEQALNARPVVDAGGALLVADADVHRRVGRPRPCPRSPPTPPGSPR